MGGHGASRGPPGLNARERLEAFQAASRLVQRAERALTAATGAHDDAPSPAFALGVRLAQMRRLQAASRLEAALNDLAHGHPPYEAFWRLPDDL